MRVVPRLLNNSNIDLLPNTLFSDLQFDKILSVQTIAVLRQPCGLSELVRRNELFALLDNKENHARIENVLSVLIATERASTLLKDARLSLDRYCRQAELFESYIASCEALASMNDLGSLFSEIAKHFSSEEKKRALEGIKESVQKIKNLLRQMSTGLLSFADKNWLTPDYEAVSEFDTVAACAEKLGFTIPKKKTKNTKINLSLSDTVCRLYADEVEQLEVEIAKHKEVDFYKPTLYISEIKFFLEIHRLIQRAANIGVPHCISRVANAPKYIAKEIYDVSLLAKNCENIVPNDAEFSQDEPFCFLIGANGGGKTTYLRSVGINLVLFLAGCPVFAKKAEIYPFEVVLSHFPKDERFDDVGRLNEEQRRTEEMLEFAQNKTAFLFFNETFSGTDDKRGFDLLSDTVSQISEKKQFGLYVTHFHEVMSLEYPVFSAEIDLADDNKRTFRIVRAKGSASSYAADILKKYGLDKDSLAARRCEYGN